MNSVFVTIYFFEWRWLIDFPAKLVLKSCYYSLVFLSNRSKLKSEIKKMWSIGKFMKKKLTSESEYKRHKSGEKPNLGLPRVHILYNCLEYQEA